METPEIILKNEASYNHDAWREYTPAELGQWVALLLKRAAHRADPAKKAKDIADAKAYHAMLGTHLDAA